MKTTNYYQIIKERISIAVLAQQVSPPLPAFILAHCGGGGGLFFGRINDAHQQ